MDSTERVRTHYTVTGLVGRIRNALAEVAPENATFKPEQLAGLDQFHTRGLAATLDLGRDAALQPDDRVLDVGCGIGGPARLLASRFGVSVIGVDLSPSFVEAGHYLTGRCGLEAQVTLEVGDATRLSAEDGEFDAMFLQHVAMNIADRAALYREARRVLLPGGRFAIYDIVRAGGEPHYPVPWAGTPVARQSGWSTNVNQDGDSAALVWMIVAPDCRWQVACSASAVIRALHRHSDCRS